MGVTLDWLLTFRNHLHKTVTKKKKTKKHTEQQTAKKKKNWGDNAQVSSITDLSLICKVAESCAHIIWPNSCTLMNSVEDET